MPVTYEENIQMLFYQKESKAKFTKFLGAMEVITLSWLCLGLKGVNQDIIAFTICYDKKILSSRQGIHIYDDLLLNTLAEMVSDRVRLNIDQVYDFL